MKNTGEVATKWSYLLFDSEQSTTQISPIEKAKHYLFACLSVPTKTVKTQDQRALFGNKMA